MWAQSPEPQQSAFAILGYIVAPDGKAVAQASVKAGVFTANTDSSGHFEMRLPGGNYTLEVRADHFSLLLLKFSLTADTNLKIQLQPQNLLVVHPEGVALSPDPSSRVLMREQVIDANPGRPGVPVSIPGLPAETASGGIKAPQYFAPGVAGDHGEPIAQFISVGGFLFPNNLSANAHGNGYADPNVLIPATIGEVQVDGGAFNVRYGDHAINLAVVYDLRPRVSPFVQVTADLHDADIAIGWSPGNPGTIGWLALNSSFGNGFLKLPEGRQQHRVAGLRVLKLGDHELSLFGAGYYGFSHIPGLVPLDVLVPADTIDPRQADLTHTTVFVLSDLWTLPLNQQLITSGYFRTYSLRLTSNFGDGLIQQSEFRTVAGANITYLARLGRNFSFVSGIDFRRDVPHNLGLDRADPAGIFHPVTSNDLTITSASPFLALEGKPFRWLQINSGLRRDQFVIDNQDRVNARNSFNQSPGITSPKATLTLISPADWKLPLVSFSYGQAFHINDPRIGTGRAAGTLIAKSRSYQLVATEIVARIEFRLTLAHNTDSAELAKIDSDTGLQEDVGPSVVKYVTASVQRGFSWGSVQASFSRADARELTRGPVPEAPRLIWDGVGNFNKLPWKLRAKGEFEYVGTKPLGDGFKGVPVREIRASVLRTFDEGRLDLGLNILLASGFTGQTLETLQLQGETAPFERPVGVRLPSYAGLFLTYRFRKSAE